ncbi:MAG: hypothetical protein HKN20_10030 [Gemmatimonadetes bacterium]|nr:hypothetical protein [Gemmatimonadota bacterium]
MYKTVVLTMFALALIGVANAQIGPQIDSRMVSTESDRELSYFPSGVLLEPIVCGFENIVADLLWLRAIQYYGRHRQTDLMFGRVDHVFRTLTDLDPHFIEAFRFGALVLVEDAHMPEEGYELLKRGIRSNPDDGGLYFDLGFHCYLNQQYDRASVYFGHAANKKGAPENAARFAAFAQNRQGNLDIAEELWMEIYDGTTNERTRASAVFALKSIAAARDTTYLAERARAYQARFGGFPRSVDDLVKSGLAPAAPEEPFQTNYIIHPVTGEVRSWYLLGRELKRDVAVLSDFVKRFREEWGRFPKDAAEIVEYGYLQEEPQPFGARYVVEPATGEVQVVLETEPLAERDL